MRSLDQFLDTYALSHRNPTNQLIHYICVPAIFVCTLALGWLINLQLLGVQGPAGYWINASSVSMALILPCFYARLGLRALAAMVLISAASIVIIVAIDYSPAPLWAVASGVFIIAWVAQFVGHHIEGAKPNFFEDLLFLLIGPLFVLEELGVPLRPIPPQHSTSHN